MSDGPNIKNGRIIEKNGEFFAIDDDTGKMYAMRFVSPEAKAWFIAQLSSTENSKGNLHAQ